MKIIKKLKSNYLIIVSALVVLTVGGYFLNKYYFSGKSPKAEGKVAVDNFSENKDNPEVTLEMSEKIVYLTENDGAKEIVSNNISGNDAKTLYTDRDEDLKINKVTNIVYLSQEALIYVATSDITGKFYIAKLDESGNKEVIDNIANPSAFAISPDGQKISYTFGNNIYLINRRGENKREIFSSNGTITGIAFDDSGENICFIEALQDSKSKISKISLDYPQQKEIYETEGKIVTLFWSKSDEIIVSLANGDFRAGQVLRMDSGGGNVQKNLRDNGRNCLFRKFVKQ